MKRVFEISLVFILSTTLCSCPYSSAYYLDESPTIYVEDALLGKWATFMKRRGTAKEESVKLTLSKRTDTEYNITFTGYLDELRPFGLKSTDSITGTAFMSTVGGNQFLNISVNSRVYIAQLKLKEDKLSLLPLLEHFTSKMIRNSTALRNSVEIHYKTRVHPMLDDDFCLRDMVKVN